MSTALALRPPGETELLMLARQAQARLDGWATAWLAGGRACATLRRGDALPGAPGADALAALGRRCTGDEAQEAEGRLPLSALHETVGRAAHEALSAMFGAGAAASRRDLCLLLDLDGVPIALRWPHADWSPALPPVRPGDLPLGTVRLPPETGRSPCRLELDSVRAELSVSELMALAPGDVVLLERSLDDPFGVHVDVAPQARLQAHLGRRDGALAIEMLPRP